MELIKEPEILSDVKHEKIHEASLINEETLSEADITVINTDRNTV